MAADRSLSAAVLTGAGEYYCSGVDFGGVLRELKLPSALVKEAEARNYAIFDAFIKVNLTGLAHILGLLQDSNRNFLSKIWANLQMLGKPCENSLSSSQSRCSPP